MKEGLQCRRKMKGVEEGDVAYEGDEGVDCGLYLEVVILWFRMCGL